MGRCPGQSNRGQANVLIELTFVNSYCINTYCTEACNIFFNSTTRKIKCLLILKLLELKKAYFNEIIVQIMNLLIFIVEVVDVAADAI